MGAVVVVVNIEVVVVVVLVHLSCSVSLSNGCHWRIVGCCFDSGWLLRFRHHLKMWCRFSDIPDLQCKIKKGGPSGMKESPHCGLDQALVPRARFRSIFSHPVCTAFQPVSNCRDVAFIFIFRLASRGHFKMCDEMMTRRSEKQIKK